MVSADATVDYVSPSVLHVFGYTAEEIISNSAFEYMHEDDQPLVAAKLFELLEQPDRVVTANFRLRHKDGSWRWTEAVGRNLLFDPSVKGIVVNYRDITKRIQATEALQAREARFRAMTEHSAEAVALIDSDGVIKYATLAATHVLGFTVEELVGQNIFQLSHADDLSNVGSLFATILQAPGNYATGEFRFPHKDGSWRWIEGVGTNLLDDPNLHAVVANFREITDRKNAEAALRDSEHRYRLLAEHSHDLIGLLDLRGGILYASPSHTRMLGYAPEQLLQANVFEMIHDEDKKQIEGRLNELLTKGTSPNVELRLRKQSGQYVDVEAALSLVDDVRESTPCILFAARDITERKIHEVSLQQQNHFLAALHETTLALMNRLDVIDVLQGVVAQATALSGVQHGYCFLLDPDEQAMHMLVGTGFFQQRRGDSIRPGESAAGVVWQSGQPLAVSDYANWSSRKPHAAFDAVRTLAAVPLISNSKVTGVLGLAHLHAEEGCFGEEDIQRLVQLGQLASVALDNAQLFTAAQQELAQRRRAEKRLRASRQELRALSGRVQSAREEERTRISRELHDELGQALTGLKIDLTWLQQRTCTIPENEMRTLVEQKHDAMLAHVDSTIQAVRRIATDLRPSVWIA